MTNAGNIARQFLAVKLNSWQKLKKVRYVLCKEKSDTASVEGLRNYLISGTLADTSAQKAVISSLTKGVRDLARSEP